jgi:hypothetical protein
MAASKPQNPTPDPERESRIQRILKQMEQKLRQSLPDPDQPLEQIEQQVVEIGQETRDLIERETLAACGSGYLGSHTPCRCGASARYVARYPRQLITLNGTRRLCRAYYHCAACQQGFCPLDQRLQLGRGESSVGVRAVSARFASYLPFEKASEELELVCRVRLSPRTLQREAQGVGEALRHQRADYEQAWWQNRAPEPAGRPPRLQITMDGVMVHVGQEWKEAKVGCVYRPRSGGGVESGTYLATLEASAPFGRRLAAVAHEAGVEYCRQVGVVGDGSEWIWQETAKHFPGAVQILDYYHMSQYLWEVARARYEEEGAAREWIQEQEEHLFKDKASEVIAGIEAWKTQTKEQAEVKERVANYLRGQEHRMRYKTYREAGYHIGSGVAEAGCKNVVQARLKGVGMRWGKPGAEAMLSLRAAWCSTQRPDFVAAARRAALAS